MRQDGDLITNEKAGGAIGAYRLVKWGAEDGAVTQATGASAHLVGTTRGAAAADDRIDIYRSGIAEVEYGGAVTRGAALTAGAGGKAVVTTTANDHIIGFAEIAGVAGDIGSVRIAPQRY